MDRIGKVQLGVSAACSGDFFLVCGRGPIWPLGRLWTAQCVVGQLCPIRGLYGQAQLVFAGGDDPALVMIATIGEAVLGLLLVLGWNIRIVALAERRVF